MNSIKRMDWLDSSGRFNFGKHEGEYVEDVAYDDRSYLEWIIDEVESCTGEDRDMILAWLDQS